MNDLEEFSNDTVLMFYKKNGEERKIIDRTNKLKDIVNSDLNGGMRSDMEYIFKECGRNYYMHEYGAFKFVDYFKAILELNIKNDSDVLEVIKRMIKKNENCFYSDVWKSMQSWRVKDIKPHYRARKTFKNIKDKIAEHKKIWDEIHKDSIKFKGGLSV